MKVSVNLMEKTVVVSGAKISDDVDRMVITDHSGNINISNALAVSVDDEQAVIDCPEHTVVFKDGIGEILVME